MKNNRKTYFCAALCLLALFALWTVAVLFIDRRPIGPHGSVVGLASLNAAVRSAAGTHMALYVLTDWLSLIPLAFAAGFAFLGLRQWFSRKKLSKVDRDILFLGLFYAAVAAVYILFELFPVNFRPLLIGGVLEASYPSSTILLVLCVMGSGFLQLAKRIKNRRARSIALAATAAFSVLMVAARLLSGVHWFSDIVGGVLLSGGLLLMYMAAISE